jgi:putative tricarboxylic transport membrane protein
MMKKNDIIAGGIFIGLGIFIFTQTFTYPSPEKGHPGPDLFPNLLALLFIIFGGVLVFKAFKTSVREEEISESPPKPKKIINAFFVMGVIAVFVALVNFLGFLVTSAVLLFVLMKKLGVSLLKSAITSIVLTLFINLMFSKILRVPLPPGILGW